MAFRQGEHEVSCEVSSLLNVVRFTLLLGDKSGGMDLLRHNCAKRYCSSLTKMELV